jgi:transcriptional regulator with GAF, ATPase, and Fis domain
VQSSRPLESLIGRGRAINELKQALERVSHSPSTVLVRGESGTGKGLVARTLHHLSPRRDQPFVQFNCAAMPETLAESELFGHEKGAFTGAVALKPGRFELAHKGTIFLDEIGKVSLAVQSKLLRVVEDKEFERVGGTRTQKVDVRIVAATNLNIEDAIAKNEFREDLYYRLNIIPIVLPPLRERKEDIPFLVEHFIRKISRDLGQEPKEVDQSAIDLFLAYRWAGNIRELEATIHRALVLTAGERLRADDFSWLGVDPSRLPPVVREPEPAVASPQSALVTDPERYLELLDDYDQNLVRAGLDRCGGRIRETARVLGIARNTLKSKLRRWGLDEGDDDAG